jgi:trigger factor
MRVAKTMREQGVEPEQGMFEGKAYLDEMRQRSERALKISLLLNAVREKYEIEVSDEDVEAELDGQAQQYPEDNREKFKSWVKNQAEQMASLRDQLLEKKCVNCIMEQAKTKENRMNLSEWQASQEKDRGESRETA